MSSDSPALSPHSPSSYDAILILSFGGPEGMEDVLPFLENVTRGKNIPPARLQEVAKHYELFDGVSPINSEIRALLTALVGELNAHGLQLPVYWGNRNWHPMLADTVQQMADDGVQRALAFVTSAFGSYPGCRQYLEDIEQARQVLGPAAPQIDKLRLFYNHPGFIESLAARTAAALAEVPPERRDSTRLIFTAHSIPTAMAERSPYERQLREACRLAAEQIESLAVVQASSLFPLREIPGVMACHDSEIDKSQIQNPLPTSPHPNPLPKGEGTVISSKSEGTVVSSKGEGTVVSWSLAFQSRSGPPSQPWLGPDIREYIRELHAAEKITDVVIVPLGFLVEHMEVIYDLDVEVGNLCDELGIHMVRAEVVGTHPRLVRMIRELIEERLNPAAPRLSLGPDGPWPDECPAGCCRS